MVSLTCILSLAMAAAGVSASEFMARAQTIDADFHLYAYSLNLDRGNIQGMPVFYADGKAYTGLVAPADASETLNITLSASTQNSNIIATADNGTLPSNTSELFYIDTGVSNFGDAGFTTTSSFSQNTTGFGLYGAWLFHISEEGAIQMNWYAEETDTEGVWTVKWNNVGSPVEDGVPISLRTQAPARPQSA